MRLLVIAILLMIAVPATALDPGQYDLTLYANEDFELNLTHTAAGQPVDLTGYSFKMAAKKSGVAVPFAIFSSVIVDAAAGKTRHRLSRRATAANANVAGTYDLLQTDPSGNNSYRMRGAFKILETVTR
ncbi:hypothetical protein KI809_10650 [Geobacter pelophilus]|uniref:DUF2207 domain-containing protein n=1 Tax=Geoanaerobacter pelophilus TaxID=60036 RepID=A0AAW4L112_9BACT|nr:hypothetical protein [Geoanaerobacter pelophilus]MBT0664759.1 hypothetical protein [Geoanaerobacter pelophilus]